MDSNLSLREIDKPESMLSVEKLKDDFDRDTAIVAEQTKLYMETLHPLLFVDSKEKVLALTYQNSNTLLESITFYRLISCTTEQMDDIFDILNDKMSKFFTALHSLDRPIVYGIIASHGTSNLVIGIYDTDGDAQILKNIMEGLLDGIELKRFHLKFSKYDNTEKEVGLISGIPSLKIDDEKQRFDLAPLLKCLNGQEYMVLFVSRPVKPREISLKYGKVLQIRDECFSVSKRTVSRQQGISRSITETEGRTETYSDSTTKSIAPNIGIGAAWNKIIGTLGIGLSGGKTSGYSVADSYTKAISNAINQNEGIASDIQNGFALELINYANKAIERLKQGNSNGMWETVITYSSNSDIVAKVIKACITGEMSKADPDILPQIMREYHLDAYEAQGNSILLPQIIMGEERMSPLCTTVTSEELGLLCSLPATPVPDFELRIGKTYPLVTDDADGVQIGTLCDGKRELKNMPFYLSYSDLARHTFVCGITGSGKTTTVKGILREAGIPFWVIESAKKEYRNIRLKDKEKVQVYTLGKPEINCLQINPFYIQCGVSPQAHIDFLKDLFNASFALYGPMPYILEKCLQNIYINKGWNLTLGFHPYLANIENSADLFEAEYMQARYAMESHKYLFPTMHDLKTEIERYIEDDLQYEGEVAGNIKTAIKARLESLCSGAKGYMFNTYEYADMQEILNQKAVLELEGLADDADKAFCVGLIIILINEYRQITKETTSLKTPLSHILVIEEAHRLLKNIETERFSEDMGNPKGKAVEHFTNMIAEMRSYGQGVIVAEQIPSKLAPDVIKNSSNKIIQRLVAGDDQNLVASTIGMKTEDAVCLGSICTGMALCHKEGMSLPVSVKIPLVEEIQVTDGMLYRENLTGRLHRINLSLVKEAVDEKIEILTLKVLNTILIQNIEEVQAAIIWYRKQIKKLLSRNGIQLVLCEDERTIFTELLAEEIMSYLLNGVYSVKCLINNELSVKIQNLLLTPTEKKLQEIKKLLSGLYKDDAAYKAKYIIAQLLMFALEENTDIAESVKKYFVSSRPEDISEIEKIMIERDIL